MNSNTVRVRLSLSFKGEMHALDAIVDLDQLASEMHALDAIVDLDQLASDAAPDFHMLLARAGGIDPYSYFYEALESHDIEFSDATGIAQSCCRDGQFDWSRFVLYRREDQDMRVVRAIAVQMLGMADLDQRDDLKAALLAAYRAGKGEIVADITDAER